MGLLFEHAMKNNRGNSVMKYLILEPF